MDKHVIWHAYEQWFCSVMSERDWKTRYGDSPTSAYDSLTILEGRKV